MKKYNLVYSIIVVIAISLFITTLSVNIVARSSTVYSFYFNDSSAVNNVYTTLSNSQMADKLAGFMNAWKPDKFEITEDTGYDQFNIFTDEEGYNMMRVKYYVDISMILCVISFIIAGAIYYLFIKNDMKKTLRTCYRVSMGTTMVMVILEMIILQSNKGRLWVESLLGMKKLAEDSQLSAMLGSEFVTMAAGFLIIVSVIVFLLASYVSYRLTKPQRIFY